MIFKGSSKLCQLPQKMTESLIQTQTTLFPLCCGWVNRVYLVRRSQPCAEGLLFSQSGQPYCGSDGRIKQIVIHRHLATLQKVALETVFGVIIVHDINVPQMH